MVDAGVATVSPITDPLEARAFEDVFKEIRECFDTTNKSLFQQIKRWEFELTARFEVSGDNFLPYLQVAAMLRDALNTGGTSTNANANWQRAIDLVLENQNSLYAFLPSYPPDTLKQFHGIAVGTAARHLIAQGYVIDFHEGRLIPNATAEQAINDKIQQLCQELGGQLIFDFILSEISNHYDPLLKRYHLVRRLTMPAPPVPIPQVPWGYLIQLAARYFDKKAIKQSVNTRALWKELRDLVRDVVALYDLQPYTVFESLLVDASSLIEFLRTHALYDSLFCMQQIRDDDLKRMCHGLLGGIELELDGVSMKGALRVFDGILSVGGSSKSFSFTAQHIGKEISSSQHSVKRVLDAVFARSSNGPNQNFGYPPVVENIDFHFQPMLKESMDTYYVPSREICSAAFFEALLSWARITDEKVFNRKMAIDDALGDYGEAFLLGEFAKHSIRTVHGYYNLGKDKNGEEQEGDCDVVVETDEYILLFELKKKALTRPARGGADISILLDLSKSLIAAQLQAMKHEKLLKKYGQIELKFGSNREHSYNLELRGRKIERIAVSFLDYGSLQYRNAIQKFLTICCVGELGTDKAELKKDVAKLQEELDKLKVLATELDLLKPPNPFYASWFLSIPQILATLDGVTNNEEFQRELFRTRSVTFGCEDFYQEYSFLRKAGVS
jgi:hypothetical protein